MITTPRCRHPVAWRDKNDEGGGTAAVCWRPEEHPGSKHRSRISYERELENKRHLRKSRGMTVPDDKPGS